jgi:hypothetical protein
VARDISLLSLSSIVAILENVSSRYCIAPLLLCRFHNSEK